jgi:pyridoxal phosphate enzyme (YggS family)
MADIKHNIRMVKDKIERTALRIGRNPEQIRLVAVTKTHPPELVNLALRAGIRHFGENKVQEAVQKLPSVTEPYEGFHFIGHLQTNKVKALLKLNPCLIHSVDSYHLAQAIFRACKAENRTQPILLEVNTSGESSKYGMEPAQVTELVRQIIKLPNLMVQGLMTIGRLSDNPEDSRQDFRLLKRLFDELAGLNIPKLDMIWLSMGMTSDFEIAIEEGANLVRIGSAIFGARQQYA